MNNQITLLVVDDNAQNLTDAFNVLTPAGYEVMFACCPRHAIDRFQSDATIKAVITDVFMPEKPIDDVYMDFSLLSDCDLDSESLDPVSKIEYAVAKKYFTNGDPDQPTGIMVAAAAQMKGLPVVFCSSERRHGDRIRWVESLCYYGLPGVINNQESVKDWLEAAEYLGQKLKGGLKNEG